MSQGCWGHARQAHVQPAPSTPEILLSNGTVDTATNLAGFIGAWQGGDWGPCAPVPAVEVDSVTFAGERVRAFLLLCAHRVKALCVHHSWILATQEIRSARATHRSGRGMPFATFKWTIGPLPLTVPRRLRTLQRFVFMWTTLPRASLRAGAPF